LYIKYLCAEMTTNNENKVNGKIDDEEEKGEKKKEPEYPPVNLSRILTLAGSIRYPYYTIGGIATFLNGAALPMFTIVLGKMFQAFYGSPDEIKSQVSMYALYFIAIGAGSFILSSSQNYCFITMGELISKNARITFFRALLKQEIGFFDQNETGKLTSRLSSDIVLIQGGTAEKFAQSIQFFAQFCVSISIALYYGWKLTLVLLSITPVLAIVGGVSTKMLASRTQKTQEIFTEAGTTAEEVFGGVRTVKSFTNEQKEKKKHKK